MSNRVIIDQTVNTVTTDQCPNIHNSVVVNNDTPSIIGVTENVTNIVTVAVPGPQGPAGLAGLSVDVTGSQYYAAIYKSNTGLFTGSIYQSESFTAIGATSSLHPNAPETFLVNSLTDSYNLISGHATIDNYVQLNIKNFSGGPSASSDIVATADIGDEESNYINMGINSSGYTAGNAIGGALDAYLYNTGENLYIGNTAQSKQIVFFNGGFDVNENAALFIHDQGTITINTAEYNQVNSPSLAVQAPNSTTNTLIEGVGDTDRFLQLVVSNKNSGSFASSDIVAYNNIDPTNQGFGFIDMGISSTNYNDPTNYPGWQAGHSYLYTDTPGLKIGSTSGSSQINIFAGGINPIENSKLILRANNQHSMTGSLSILGSLTNGDATSVIGIYSHAEGYFTSANGDYSHAEGTATSANGTGSHAEGFFTFATGDYSHAEGENALASGYASHAEGINIQANATASHAEGANTQANGEHSHAEGYGTLTNGLGSHAEGANTQANGDYSHAEGLYTIASGSYQHVQGKYNIASSAEGAFIIGNGTSPFTRRNLVFASSFVFQITGSLQVSGSITGSLFGTSSWALNAITASYVVNAISASYVSGSGAIVTNLTSSNDARINGLTIGKGASNINKNTVVGKDAFLLNTVGDNNVAIGAGTLASSSEGTFNTAIGTEALQYNTLGSYNVAIGGWTMRNNTTGILNTAVGTAVMLNTTTGNNNSAFGNSALFYNIIGDSNSAFGYQSMLNNISGVQNTAVGNFSLYSNGIGGYNTAIGAYSGNTATSGSYNTTIGYQSGLGNISGSNNTIIGSRVIGLPIGLSNNIILADGAGNIKYRWDGTQNTISGGLNVTGGSITGSDALFTGTLTAQTLVVQTITSSIDFVTGSTRFGSILSNTHQFTGSVSITGSLTSPNITGSLFGTASWALNAITASYVPASAVVGLNLSQISTGSISASVSLNSGSFELISGSTSFLFVSSSGNVGIGTTSPGFKLDVNGTARISGNTTVNGNVSLTASTGYFSLQNGASWSPNSNESSLYSIGLFKVTTNNGICLRVASDTFGGGSAFPISSLAIGTSTNLASSLLTLESTTKGFLPPRMTTTQRDAIASPATGLSVYNTTTNENNTYNGTAWVAAGGGMSIGGAITSATMGSVLFAGVGGILQQDNANFFFDDSGNRLGIGTNTFWGTTKGLIVGDAVDARLGVSTSGRIGVYLGFISDTCQLFAYNYNSNVSRLLSLNSFGGNVAIGTTADAGFKLDVNGTARVSGSLSIGNTNIEFQENTNVTSGSWRVVSSEPTASYKAAFFDYVMFSGSIARAGTVYSVWSASYAEFYENYTGDVGGSTSGVTLQAAISGSNIQLQATASNSNWTIRSLVRML